MKKFTLVQQLWVAFRARECNLAAFNFSIRIVMCRFAGLRSRQRNCRLFFDADQNQIWFQPAYCADTMIAIRYVTLIAIALFSYLSYHTGASATSCEQVRASSSIKYRSDPAHSNDGIVPLGFVNPSSGVAVQHGIDASKYQDEADFGGVRACGGSFAYIRLSAGANPDNERSYSALWANAKNSGLLVGPYHHLNLIDPKSPISGMSPIDIQALLARNVALARDQAQLFKARLIEVLGRDPVSQQAAGAYGAPFLPAVLDLSERPQVKFSAADQAAFGPIYRAAACEWISTFQSDPRFRKQPVVLFTKAFIYRDFAFDAADCDLKTAKIWLSYHSRNGDDASTEQNPQTKTAVETLCANTDSGNRCILQQYTSYGGFAVFDPNAGLDLSRFYGTLDDLRKLLQSAKPN